MSEEENILINPEDLNRKRDSRKNSKEEDKYRVKGNSVEINFESDGRFSLPNTMYFEDYGVEDIQEFAVVDIDDLLETLVVILDKLKNQDSEVSIADATPHELLEILLGMKVKFDVPYYKHHWMCECQTSKPDQEQQVSEATVNLNEFKFKSISEIDEKFKMQFERIFNSMTDEEFSNFLNEKYKNEQVDIKTWTRKDEIDSTRISEPINYRNNKTGDVYSFNIMRMKNVIDAQKLVKEKYRPLITSIQKEKNNNEPIHVFKDKKEEKLKKIERNKAKDIITFSEALSLTSVNGKEINSSEEKIEYYKKLKRDDYFDLEQFLKDIDFGIYYEGRLSCPFCGKTEGRVLQQDINPIGLIPIDPDSKVRGVRKDDGRINIYFGV